MITCTTTTYVSANGDGIRYYYGASFHARIVGGDTNDLVIQVEIKKAGGDSGSYDALLLYTTSSALAAYTGSGSGDTGKFFNAVEQYYKAQLEAHNPSLAFTIT